MTLTDLIPWACSLTAVLSSWFQGRKSLLGPIFGVLGFIPWISYELLAHAWGLIPLSLIITALQVRCLILWRRAEP